MVNFRSYVEGCDEPTNCSVEVADTVLRQGQGMHGSFGRGDTLNFMAAIGPDFKAGYTDPLPVSNADVGMTIAQLLGLRPAGAGGSDGPGDVGGLAERRRPQGLRRNHRFQPAANGLQTVREIPARVIAALFRRGRLSGPDRRA